MANCKQCGQEYEAKRSTSHYCSPKCKQEFYRNRMSTVTPKSVTARPVKPVTVTGAKRGKDIKCQQTFVVVTGKPGDADYNGVCTEVWRAERGR